MLPGCFALQWSSTLQFAVAMFSVQKVRVICRDPKFVEHDDDNIEMFFALNLRIMCYLCACFFHVFLYKSFFSCFS